MNAAVSYEPATTRTVDLHGQAEGDELARVATPGPWGTSQPGGKRHPARPRRGGRQRRLGTRMWTLLHAQALLDGSDTHPYQR